MNLKKTLLWVNGAQQNFEFELIVAATPDYSSVTTAAWSDKGFL